MYTIVSSCTVIIPYNLYCTHNSHNRICQAQQKTWYCGTHIWKSWEWRDAKANQNEITSLLTSHDNISDQTIIIIIITLDVHRIKPNRIQNGLKISEIIPQSVQQNSQLCVQLHTIYYNLTATILFVMYKKSIDHRHVHNA